MSHGHPSRRLLLLVLPVAAILLAGAGAKTFLTEIGVVAQAPAESTPAHPSQALAATAERPTAHDDWVRTQIGWEHESKWLATTRYEPALHPAVVAVLVSLVALWAMVAFPAERRRRDDDQDSPDTTFTPEV